MKTLHNIHNTQLPDPILAELWRIQTAFSGSYIYQEVHMQRYSMNFHPYEESPIICKKRKTQITGYRWMWEDRLKEWIRAGKPKVDMSRVTIIP